MNKTVRNLALAAALLATSAPMFANMMGTDPHPQSVGLSMGSYAGIILSVMGLG